MQSSACYLPGHILLANPWPGCHVWSWVSFPCAVCWQTPDVSLTGRTPKWRSALQATPIPQPQSTTNPGGAGLGGFCGIMSGPVRNRTDSAQGYRPQYRRSVFFPGDEVKSRLTVTRPDCGSHLQMLHLRTVAQSIFFPSAPFSTPHWVTLTYKEHVCVWMSHGGCIGASAPAMCLTPTLPSLHKAAPFRLSITFIMSLKQVLSGRRFYIPGAPPDVAPAFSFLASTWLATNTCLTGTELDWPMTRRCSALCVPPTVDLSAQLLATWWHAKVEPPKMGEGSLPKKHLRLRRIRNLPCSNATTQQTLLRRA